MAKNGTPGGGRDRLEEAMALLIHNQAALTAQQAEDQRYHLKYEREMNERVNRIEAQLQHFATQLAEVVSVISEHSRVIGALTEAVREKIGFKVP